VGPAVPEHRRNTHSGRVVDQYDGRSNASGEQSSVRAVHGEIRPPPLTFSAAQEFVPDDSSPEERIFTWGIFGCVPYYLDGVDLNQDLGTVLTEELLSQKGYLHNEPEYVLRTELTDPNRYFAILTAIAAGKTTSNEIAQVVGIDGKQISTYTQKLEQLRLIEREVPITEEKAKSRRGRYRILDPLFRFWFRFVYGKEDRYERLGENAYDAVVEPELPDFVSQEFENLCQDALPDLYPEETFLDIGRWWYKEHEVDVVGFTTDGTMVVGECKFTNAPLDYGALASLEDQAGEIRETPETDERDTEYALFTRVVQHSPSKKLCLSAMTYNCSISGISRDTRNLGGLIVQNSLSDRSP